MTRVAAVQMDARLGDLKYNLQHVKELASEAVAGGAEVISLPEFFTTPIILDDGVRSCILPPENEALDLLKELASTGNVLIGGSYLEKRDGEVYNCYTLVRPDGTVTRHDKDLPTMVENAYYVAGKTDGIHQTNIGRVGTAVCWEQIRTQTVKRLAGKVDFLMTGTHWWGPATNWPSRRSSFEKASADNLALFHGTPSKLSRLLGVANIHASHCGTISGKFALPPGGFIKIPCTTELQGETQIVDKHGEIVARRSRDEGAGVIFADIDVTPGSPSLGLPDRFWIPEMPEGLLDIWETQNKYGKKIYAKAKKAGEF